MARTPFDRWHRPAGYHIAMAAGVPSRLSPSAFARLAGNLASADVERSGRLERQAAAEAPPVPALGAKEPHVTVRLASARDIPEHFRSIGSGFYRLGHSIWEMKVDDRGDYNLVRKHEERAVDMREEPRTASRKSTKAGPGDTVLWRREGQVMPVLLLQLPSSGDGLAQIMSILQPQTSMIEMSPNGEDVVEADYEMLEPLEDEHGMGEVIEVPGSELFADERPECCMCGYSPMSPEWSPDASEGVSVIEMDLEGEEGESEDESESDDSESEEDEEGEDEDESGEGEERVLKGPLVLTFRQAAMAPKRKKFWLPSDPAELKVIDDYRNKMSEPSSEEGEPSSEEGEPSSEKPLDSFNWPSGGWTPQKERMYQRSKEVLERELGPSKKTPSKKAPTKKTTKQTKGAAQANPNLTVYLRGEPVGRIYAEGDMGCYTVEIDSSDRMQGAVIGDCATLSEAKQIAADIVFDDLYDDAPLSELDAEPPVEDELVFERGDGSAYVDEADFEDDDDFDDFDDFEDDDYPFELEASVDHEAAEGLWDNIRKKRERGEKPAKPGDEDYPDKKTWNKLTKKKKSAALSGIPKLEHVTTYDSGSDEEPEHLFEIYVGRECLGSILWSPSTRSCEITIEDTDNTDYLYETDRAESYEDVMDLAFSALENAVNMRGYAPEDEALEMDAAFERSAAEGGKYSHIDFTPPKSARSSAQRGLDLRKEHGRGGTAVGIARARDIARGAKMSASTVKRMKAFFDRHQKNRGRGDEGKPSNGYIAWQLWGGDSGRSWANKVVKQMEAADNKGKKSAAVPMFIAWHILGKMALEYLLERLRKGRAKPEITEAEACDALEDAGYDSTPENCQDFMRAYEEKAREMDVE